jgi:hypothetical protein
MIRLELLHPIQQRLEAAAQEVVPDDDVRIMSLYRRQERVEQSPLSFDGLEW